SLGYTQTRCREQATGVPLLSDHAASLPLRRCHVLKAVVTETCVEHTARLCAHLRQGTGVFGGGAGLTTGNGLGKARQLMETSRIRKKGVRSLLIARLTALNSLF